MPTLLLTSRGITPKKTFQRLTALKKDLKLQTCGLLYNAAGGPDKKYVVIAKQQLEAAGLRVTLLDALSKSIDKYDVLYIAGGNTFDLLRDIRSGIGIDSLRQALLSAKLIIAVSAGAIILAPTIRIVSEIQPDENKHSLTDFISLGILNYEVLPHYSEGIRSKLDSYKKRYRTDVMACGEEDYIEVIIDGLPRN